MMNDFIDLQRIVFQEQGLGNFFTWLKMIHWNNEGRRINHWTCSEKDNKKADSYFSQALLKDVRKKKLPRFWIDPNGAIIL